MNVFKFQGHILEKGGTGVSSMYKESFRDNFYFPSVMQFSVCVCNSAFLFY